MNISFNVHNGSSTSLVGSTELQDYASLSGLTGLANGRYSQLFVLNLMLLESQNGVDPQQVLEQIKHLEDELAHSSQTKPASEFRGASLKGLWHKHFMPALPSVMAHNIMNHLSNGKLHKLVEEVMDPSKSSIVTKDMINELSHRLVFGSINERANAGKLTGEWIIFAKENGKNYYLCICPHNMEDESIANSIKSACLPEFGFLSKYVS